LTNYAAGWSRWALLAGPTILARMAIPRVRVSSMVIGLEHRGENHGIDTIRGEFIAILQ
jgi:hypothetical protein